MSQKRNNKVRLSRASEEKNKATFIKKNELSSFGNDHPKVLEKSERKQLFW